MAAEARAWALGGGAGARASSRASMKPVSTSPAMKSGWSRQRARKPALVLTGQTSTSLAAWAKRSLAPSRVGAWAISLAIIGS